ncbi:putative (DL)-glycerol-3-phosphatase protein [Anopheles sinensis]|uniref:Putative (DL)-glycerol-3-phosphatase protein n=1 Tax=Anopheles sinensis TaxID=74873 RepID=A0A084W939_ANOSI|nr:putative (DL)-glycerol-3-phosphatase protein [Anopheles sinensis]
MSLTKFCLKLARDRLNGEEARATLVAFLLGCWKYMVPKKEEKNQRPTFACLRADGEGGIFRASRWELDRSEFVVFREDAVAGKDTDDRGGHKFTILNRRHPLVLGSSVCPCAVVVEMPTLSHQQQWWGKNGK